MTCILTTVSQQIVDAIETKRQAAGFAVNDFVCDWDFDRREQDVELTDNRIHVRVVVPRKWEVARRVDRGTTLEYIGIWDIDVRQKVGVTQSDSNFNAERDRIEDLVEMVEGIHLMFHTNPASDSPYNLQWLAEHDAAPSQSEILIAYSPRYLREHGQFYGVCREVFQVTT